MADLDGVVRIGTELDDSGFRRGMQNLGRTARNSLGDTEQEFRRTERASDRLSDSLDDVSEDMRDLAQQSDRTSGNLNSLGSAMKGGLIAAGTAALVGGFANAINSAVEFDNRLSRLRTNIDLAGSSVGAMQENLSQFQALTGDVDTSVEALSNLLQTGFDDAGITQAVDALSGAVVMFPDTLSIESLADGLQETLATGEAAGQFSEVLDRLGIGAETFNAQLAGVSTEAEKQQLVLETLANAGLNDVYNKYAEANQAQLEYKEAQFELEQAMSTFAIATLPLVNAGLTTIADGASRLAEAYREGGLTGLLQEAQNMTMEFLQSIQQQAPQLIQAGFDFLNNIVMGIVNAIPKIAQTVPQIVIGFLNTLRENYPTILENGKELIINLVTGIVNGIPDLISALPKIISAVVSFLINAIPQIVQTGIDLIIGLAKGIINGIPDLIVSILQLRDAINAEMWNIVKSIPEIGANIVRGLWQGILDMGDWLLGKISEWCGSILDGIKGFFGIKSPSRVMRDIVGKNLVYGMIDGVKALSNNLTKEIVKPVQIATKKVKDVGLSKGIQDAIKNAKNTAKKEAESYKEIGDIITNSISKGVESNMENSLLSLEKLLDDELQKLQEKQESELSAITDESKKKEFETKFKEQQDKAMQAATEIMKSYEEAMKNGAELAKKTVSESLSRITDVFQQQYDDLMQRQSALENNLGSEYLFEVEEDGVVIQDLENSIEILNKYGEAVEKLKEKGASASLLEEIARFSPEEGLQVVDELLSMADEDFTTLNELWAEKQKLAKETAAEFYQEQLDLVEKEFHERLNAELEKLPDEIYDIGTQSVQGWIDGMDSKLPALEEKSRELAKKALAAMKSQMGIASPSKDGILDAGVAEGVNKGVSMVQKSIDKIGFFDKVKAAIPKMQATVSMSMAHMQPSVIYGGGGNTIRNITTNEGAFILNVGKIDNKGKGSTEQFLEEAEAYRIQKARAKGGK